MKEGPFQQLRALADRAPAVTDAIIAAGFVATGLASSTMTSPEPSPVSPAVVIAVLALYVPLAWRRRTPLAALAAVTVVIALFALSGLPQNPLFGNGWLVAAYSAGVYGKGRWRTWVRAGSAAVFTPLLVADRVSQDRVPGDSVLGVGLLAAAYIAFVGWIWLYGDVVRAAREREAELAERTVQLEREREANARRAVFEERVRIARELHDVVAHHVSLMGVQAGAARRVLHQRPEKAEQALLAIETTSREAVRELHRLLGFLRREEDSDGLTPQPSLRHLNDLLAQIRDAGLPITLEVEGEARSMPPAVDLSAYRIVQEALTNALRHAGPAAATVRLCYGPRDLVIEVVDDGRGLSANGSAPATTPGAGLVGMHERVGLLGGRLRIERPPGGGFLVRAEVPLNGESA